VKAWLPTVESLTDGKGAITSKRKHAIKHKTSSARLAQLLQPSLDIFIHHRGGRNKQKKNSDNNNSNMEEGSNL